MKNNFTDSAGKSWKLLLLLTGLLIAGSYANAQVSTVSYSGFTNPLFIPDTLSSMVYDTIQLDIEESSIALFKNSSASEPPIPGVPWQPQDTLPISTLCYNNPYPGANNPGILGPTLIWHHGDSVTMKVRNTLMMESTTHWHGAHVAPWNDGGPHQIIQPMSDWTPSFKIRDDVSTMWYHPHLHMMTMEQVQKGMAGMIIVKNSADPFASLLPHDYGKDDFPVVIQDKFFAYDNSIGRDTINWCCSMGTVPLVNGTWKPSLEVPTTGQVRLRMLNGSSERTYCIFLQKGTNPNNHVPFKVIASDAGYLEQPYPMGTPPDVEGDLDSLLIIMPGERYEIVFDASVIGTDSLFLVNRRDLMRGNLWVSTFAGGPSYDNPGCYSGGGPPAWQIVPTPGDTIDMDSLGYPYLNGDCAAGGYMLPSQNFDSIPMVLMKITASPSVVPSDPVASIPGFLAPYDIPPASQVSIIRQKNLLLNLNFNPPFSIDSLAFDENYINDVINLNAVEVWRVSNFSSVAHPFHMHDIHFFVQKITHSVIGNDTIIPVPPYMAGPKDVMAVSSDINGGPGQSSIYVTYEFITKFTDFATAYLPQNGYMYHCHILDHEDGGMMHQFVVVDPMAGVEDSEPLFGWDVFPNPSEGELWMRGICEEPSTLKLTDYQGQLVREWNMGAIESPVQLDLSGLSSGIYVVQWERREGTATKRISVMR